MPKHPDWNCWSRGYTWPVSHISILPPDREVHYLSPTIPSHSFPCGSVSKECVCNVGDCLRRRRLGFDPWVGKIPCRREWQPTPVFLPWEIPWTEEPGGLTILWGRKESDTIKSQTQHSCSLRLTRVK